MSLPRRFAIGDVHGCLLTLQTLLEDRLRVSPDDEVFLLGDLLNRGPHSAATLDYLMDQRAEGYRWHCLRGNHEQDFLMAYDRGPDFLHPYLAYSHSLDLLTDRLHDYLDFCESLPLFLYSPGFVMVHAGLDLTQAAPLSDRDTLLGGFVDLGEHERFQGRRILHGHEVRRLSAIRAGATDRAAVIGLDNGCVFARPRENFDHQGNLCALNLDTFELSVQPNVEEANDDFDPTS
jgi:serine/threonine protein phosphatase 1